MTNKIDIIKDIYFLVNQSNSILDQLGLPRAKQYIPKR